ncbi:MAG TPA: hypothetical protein VGB83_11525 [Actinomycetota bacterium]
MVLVVVLAGIGLVVAQAISNYELLPAAQTRFADYDHLLQGGSITADQHEQFVAANTTEIERLEATLDPAAYGGLSARFAGSAVGVLLAVFMAAAFVGAEFRWGYWSMLLVREPRRHRLLASKLVTIAMATIVLATILVAAGYVAGLILAALHDVPAASGSGFGAVMAALPRAWIPALLYAVIATVGSIVARSSLAGVGTAGGLIMADGLLLSDIGVFGNVSPVHRVANLVEVSQSPVRSVIWFPGGGFPAGGIAAADVAVLFGWAAVAVLGAVLVVRRTEYGRQSD